LPIADVLVDVPENRLTKDYHRKWQAVVAHYQALMRYRDSIDASGKLIDDGTYRTWLGVPRFMYRECLDHVIGWLRAVLTGCADDRFHQELRICYYVSFFRTRWATAWAARSRRWRKMLAPLTVIVHRRTNRLTAPQ
jgi:hypothetical protein